MNKVYIHSLKEGIKTLFPDFDFDDKFNGDGKDSQEYIRQAESFLDIKLEKPEENAHLTNIFEQIEQGKSNKFFHLKPLDLEKETFIPQANKQGDLSQVRTAFKNDYKNISQNSLETLFYLLKKHLSFVPVNSTESYINTFEFLKLRSAFAQCLYENTEEPLPFLMLCIDISGIQGFIYNIASGKAAKSLKGRSFYLQLLMDSLIQRVIQDTQKANIGHTIYASGGKAYLLLPNLESVKTAIKALEKEVEREVYKEHKESLYVLMDWVEFGDESKNNIANLWTKLSDKTARKKYKKYQDLLTQDFNKFFEPNNEDGFDTSNNDKTVCAVTGEVIKKPNKKDNLLKEVNGEPVWVTKNVLEQAELGTQLKNTQFYITYQGDKSLSKESRYYAINPVNLEILSYIKDEKDFINEYKKTGTFASIKYSLARKINDTNFLAEDTINEKDASYGFTFYGGNKQALKKDEQGKEYIKDKQGNFIEKDYEELTGLTNEDEKGKGFRRLGILRMDVDGLGGLFANKMKEKKLQNFPAYAMVSAHLENFFAGYLNTIRNQEKYEDWVNILYSGGDDVFAVGRWDLILEFAKEIQESFKTFVSNKITLSAGVAMIGGKFPISKGAELAGFAESQAKSFGKREGKEAQKNAISLFGEVVSWNELTYIKDIRDKLIEFDKIIPAGFRQKLLSFQATKNKHLKFEGSEAEGRQKEDLSYKWHSAYSIARLAKELKSKDKKAYEVLLTIKEDLQEPEKAYTNRLGNKGLKYDREDLQKFLAEMQKDLFIADRNFDLYAVASRWASLILRK